MKRPTFFRTTAFKLTAIFLTIFCLFSAVTLGYFGFVANKQFAREMDRGIEREIRALSREYQRRGLRGVIRFVDRRSRQPGAGVFLVTDARGQYLTGNISELPAGLLEKDREHLHPLEYERRGLDGEEEDHRALVRVFDLPSGFHLIVGRDVGERNQMRQIALGYMMVSLGVLLFAAAVAWFLVGRHVLRRLDDMSLTSQKIVAGNLSERLPVHGSGDEFDRLAQNVNEMLNRIELLMAGLKEVSDNIAHDLKTPLTRMRNRIETALASDTSVENYHEALEDTVQESDNLIRTFDALLRIARVEAGSTGVEDSDLDAGAVVADIAELYEPVAEEAGVAFEFKQAASPLPIRTNRELISQALANLIDNAIKYAAAEGIDTPKVEVSVIQSGDSAKICVADNGPGIPAEDRERVLQRFVRLEKSRTKPGSGLGLSLVSAVAKLAGGKIELGDNDPGLVANLMLPLHTHREEKTHDG